jgi:hypothetical protein
MEKEISLAKAQADYQDQQVQLRERESAFEGRKIWQSFITKTGRENEEFREWRIQRDEWNASKFCRKSIDSVLTKGYRKTKTALTRLSLYLQPYCGF